ncbi:hypothetical protein HMPREF0673_01727 [Leyella stercorea DSM 18206]|uniref:Uncharacterized protein n=1 Tax=Leyella stercorea DSM 18206 TaxID=1002367 RepID=G6AYL6_9BACT|nr:hypothetical protein HMPREF0673_01727 [Leyella stercorea DSM 18206]
MFSLLFVIGFNCIDMAKLAKKNCTAKYFTCKWVRGYGRNAAAS